VIDDVSRSGMIAAVLLWFVDRELARR